MDIGLRQSLVGLSAQCANSYIPYVQDIVHTYVLRDVLNPKNNEKNKNKNNLNMVLMLRSHKFLSKISKFVKEIGLRRVLTTSSCS